RRDGELRRDRQWRRRVERLSGPRGGVQWLRGPDDPRGARWLEAVGHHLPGDSLARLVVTGAPVELPEPLAPRALLRGEGRIVRVDVNLVGIDAHAQLASAIGQGGE